MKSNKKESISSINNTAFFGKFLLTRRSEKTQTKIPTESSSKRISIATFASWQYKLIYLAARAWFGTSITIFILENLVLIYLAIRYNITDFPVPVGYSANMADFLLFNIKNINAHCSALGFILILAAI